VVLADFLIRWTTCQSFAYLFLIYRSHDSDAFDLQMWWLVTYFHVETIFSFSVSSTISLLMSCYLIASWILKIFIMLVLRLSWKSSEEIPWAILGTTWRDCQSKVTPLFKRQFQRRVIVTEFQISHWAIMIFFEYFKVL